MTEIMALHTILLDTSLMPIGLTPGFLSKAISLQAVKLARPSGSTYVEAIFLATSARLEQRSSQTA
jgi:hypothetical protein